MRCPSTATSALSRFPVAWTDGSPSTSGTVGCAFPDVLEPAQHFATEGFPASPLLAKAIPKIAHIDGADDYRRSPVTPGTTIRRPGVARTLAPIIDGGRQAFYEGEFGNGLRRIGDGLFTEDDLTRRQADWVRPLGLDVWRHRISTVPPNSQGYITLAAARILELIGVTPASAPRPAASAWAHALVEAAGLAGHDRLDVLHEDADGVRLLRDDLLQARADRFDPQRRCDLPAGQTAGDTAHICVADGDGMAVSLIQSNARGWGAHLTVPG